MSSNTLKTILLLAANPKGTTPLRLDEEVREIDAGLQRARQREQFVLEEKWAVRPRDIQRAMLDSKPSIVHFSGHGTEDEGLVFEDETGQAKLVDGEALAGLFELFAEQVECVVLNGCYSEVQATAIAQHVNYVIGMKLAIGDRAAIEFAVGFYDALGAGRTVEFAHKFGCAAIRLAGIPEQLTPILKKKANIGETVPKISWHSNQPSSTIEATSFASNAPIEVFFSYSHQDEQLRDELAKHLSILKRQGIITAWYDREISAGTEWAGEIDAHLNTAHIILLLVSTDFLASDYCYDIELTRAMERHAAGDARVIPVILREVDWKGAPFGKLKALPKDALPVTHWASHDQAFADIARGIRKAVEELTSKKVNGLSFDGTQIVDQENQVLLPANLPRSGLQGYDQALKRYEEEFSKAVQLEHQLSHKKRYRLESLRSALGIRDDDLEAIEMRTEDIEEIRLAVSNQSIQNCQRLAQAILRRMGATDLAAITSPHFSNSSLWEITLPSTGLQLPTQNAIFYLSQKSNFTLHNHLKEITEQRDGAFLIFASVIDKYPQGLTPLQVIWLNPSSLIEMIATPENELLVWLARFLFGQINVVALPGMLPYKAKGIAKLFFGRENELARITSGNQRGGIIIGAHRSGKTSFLEKLKEKLQQRAYKVIGPLTFFELQSFFKDTLEPLGKDFSMGMSLEDWSSALKAYSENKQESRLVFLFDEVDRMIQEDLKNGANLGQKMRALQNEGYCEFFLAGHAKLREALTIEGGPFRNFAEELTFTGLTKEAATHLIQRPMKLLGFEVSDAQANRIYEGTSGVAVLIQEFCLKLLDELRLSGASQISDKTIEEVEQSPDFLDIVFEHYKYAQTWDSMAIALLTAMKGEVQRKDITGVFKEHGIVLSRDQLDKALDFLKQFGVLQKLKNGHFRVLSGYLTDAIKINDPDSLLESELGKGSAG